MRTSLLLFVAIALAAQSEIVQAAPSDSYQQAHAAAVAAIAAAAEKGFAWSTSDQLLIDAKKAAESGEGDLAIALADEARMHAELALLQANREALAWREQVISKK